MNTFQQASRLYFSRGAVALLGLTAALAVVTASAEAETVALFTFETSAPTTAGPFAAETNNTGFTMGAMALGAAGGATPTYSSPAGNGSAHSFSANGFAVGGYYQFSINSTNFAGLSVSYDQGGSGTGPRDFVFQYSTNGGSTFTTLAGSAYQLANVNFVPGTVNPAFTHTFDLSSITGLDSNANDVFRITVADNVSISGGTIAAAGTDRIDNFTLSTVPEPSTVFGGLLTLGAVGWSQRRRFFAFCA